MRFKCLRCEHVWKKKKYKEYLPTECPRCRNKQWNTPRLRDLKQHLQENKEELITQMLRYLI